MFNDGRFGSIPDTQQYIRLSCRSGFDEGNWTDCTVSSCTECNWGPAMKCFGKCISLQAKFGLHALDLEGEEREIEGKEGKIGDHYVFSPFILLSISEVDLSSLLLLPLFSQYLLPLLQQSFSLWHSFVIICICVQRMKQQ